MYVIVYNGLGSNRSSILRLPVSVEANFEVARLDSNATPDNLRSTPCSFADSTYVLAFGTGPLPPMGATVFRIRKSDNIDGKDFFPSSSIASNARMLEQQKDLKELAVTNGLFTAKFDRSTGMLTALSMAGTDVNVSQTWGYYTSFDNKQDNSTDDEARGDQVSWKVFIDALGNTLSWICTLTDLLRHRTLVLMFSVQANLMRKCIQSRTLGVVSKSPTRLIL